MEDDGRDRDPVDRLYGGGLSGKSSSDLNGEYEFPALTLGLCRFRSRYAAFAFALRCAAQRRF
jgi:hypothetical protein